jgi:FkbM family methyltransferase
MIDPLFIRQVGVWKWAWRFPYVQFRRRVLRADSRLRLPTGVTMHLPRDSQNATEIFVTNADLDWGAEALFASFADPARDLLDIGAHVGYYAAYLSPLVRRVYAFEPDARTLPALHVNARRAPNIEVIEAAVSSNDGVAPIHVGRGSALASLESDGTGVTVPVRVLRIDTFAASRPELSAALVKTDVEGHDLEALRGMDALVRRDQPLILTECEGTEALAALCRAWDYTIFAFTRDRQTSSVTFRRMAAGDLGTAWTKMLFLVPKRLDEAMAARAAAGGPAGR